MEFRSEKIFIYPTLFAAIQIGLFLAGQLFMMSMLNLFTIAAFLGLLQSQTELRGRFHKRIFSALFISLIGLAFFEFQEAKYHSLIATAGFVLMPQILFTRAFYLDFKSAPELDKTGARVAILLAFLISVGYYLLIRSHLVMLKLPVMVGIFTLSLMFMMACFRNMRVNKESFSLVLAGVLCYMFAEGIFAYSSLVVPIAGIELIYTLVWMCSLYLLVLGTISRKLLSTPE